VSAVKLWLTSSALAQRHPLVRAGRLAVLVSLALVLLVGALFWWPAQRAHNQAAAEADVKRKTLMTVMHAKEIARAHALATKQIEVLERKLNADKVQASLVEQLSALAGKHGIKIVSEVFEQGREQKGYLPLHLELNVQGSYSGLRGFLIGLQSLPTWTYVQEGAITADQNRGVLKARLRLVTYRRVAPARGA
jgi:Tfp pilus assembly protein PilO